MPRCMSITTRPLRTPFPRPAQPTREDILGLLQGLQQDLGTSNPKGDSPSHGEAKAQEEKKTLENMPLSPLMHPNLIKARQRHLEAKPLPGRDKTGFQLLFEKNPYGLLFKRVCFAVR